MEDCQIRGILEVRSKVDDFFKYFIRILKKIRDYLGISSAVFYEEFGQKI